MLRWQAARGASSAMLLAQRVEFVDAELPEFNGTFFDGKEKPAKEKKVPLKTYEEYDKMSEDDLRKLHDIRTQQISELKQLHERTHRNVEYYYRKQALDYDERALNYGEAAGSLVMDQISYHRIRLGDLRQKDWTGGRDKGIVLWACFIVSVLWWMWLAAHYPRKPTIANKGVTGSSARLFNNPFTSDQHWLGKHVLTAWEKEQIEKDAHMYPHGVSFTSLDGSAGSSGYVLHEMPTPTKPKA
jgi:hypothetical protein